MLIAHEEKLKYVIDILPIMTGEMNQLFYTENGKEIVASRVQLIIVFTIIDVLASYWFEYLGKTGKPSERFEEYINRFCFVTENSGYAIKKYLKGMTIDSLSTLRNGLVHFYGLGNHSCTILPNITALYSEKKLDSAVKNIRKMRPNIRMIQPCEFKNIVIESAILLVNHLYISDSRVKDQIALKLAHAEGISRIYQKLINEGASNLSQEMIDAVGTMLPKIK